MTNIKKIVKSVLEEQIKNKQLFDRLYTKWRESLPNLTPEDAEKIYLFHDRRKGNIKRGHPSVEAFLDRFDGNHGSKKYELKNLLDVQQINIIDLIEFLNDFGDFGYQLPKKDGDVETSHNEEELKKIFSESGKDFTPEKIEASKQMWYAQNALINNDGVRVYDVRNQEIAIRMGYYYQIIHKEHYIKKVAGNREYQYTNAPWCVTWREGVAVYHTDQNGEKTPLYTQYDNRYKVYRNPDGSDYYFYFVIDENKNKEDKYYMSSLMIKGNGRYVLTSLRNDGDNVMSWNDICAIYPQLTDFKDKIKHKKLSDDDYQKLSIIDVINETPGDVNNYQRQSNDVKLQYIQAGGSLTQPRSWEVSNNLIRRAYISTINAREDVDTKFSNLAILSTILNTPGFMDMIERKLSQINHQIGISGIADRLLKSDYEPYHSNIKNKLITIYQHKRSKKYGIYIVSKATWLNLNGITYYDNYDTDQSIYVDDKGNYYIVETYTIGGTVNEKTFYSLYSTSEENKDTDAYIFTQKKWEELLEKEHLTDINEKPDLDLDKESDVSEHEN
jgi:hypothetical protein